MVLIKKLQNIINKINNSEKYNLDDEIFETQQAILLDKADYVAELMMVSSPLTFVELVGCIFFENVRGNFNANANSVLQSPGMKDVFEDKDFTYIKDLANGSILAARSKNGINQIFNITCGKGQTLFSYVSYLKSEFPKMGCFLTISQY